MPEAAQAALAEGLQAPAQVVMDPIHIRSVMPCALTGTDPIQRLEVELEGAQPEDRPLLWAQGQSPPFGTAARVQGWEHHWDSPARLVISIGPGLAATPICLHLAMVRGSGGPGSLTEVRSLPRLPPEEARELQSLPPESALALAGDLSILLVLGGLGREHLPVLRRLGQHIQLSTASAGLPVSR